MSTIVTENDSRAITKEFTLLDVNYFLFGSLSVFITILPYFTKILNVNFYRQYVLGEFGIIEILTFILLLLSVIIGTIAYFKSSSSSLKVLKWWMLLVALCCLYFGGEEISWGQTYLQWDTPEAWKGINTQNETNFHNTTPLLDQLPRAILTGLIALAGFIPITLKLFKVNLDPMKNIFYWVLPTLACLPVSISTIILDLPQNIYKLQNLPVPKSLIINIGETKECLFGLFFLTYVSSILVRLNKNKN